MPIFEYQCASCGKEFESLVRNATTRPECPACKGTDLRKKLSAFAMIAGTTSMPQGLPAACQSCGHPDGPGACGFDAN